MIRSNAQTSCRKGVPWTEIFGKNSGLCLQNINPANDRYQKKQATSGTARKGDVLGVARLAGIMGAKKTSDLIPLCHPLPLTAVSTALLTIYDMCKAMDKGMEITDIHLEEKSGGKSGHYQRK